MTLATLANVLPAANAQGRAVAGLVCLGWEDARAYLAAAVAEDAPVILQVGPGARAHTPLSVWAAMLRPLAEDAPVPVVIHLDHGHSRAECELAIELGFTSVMFDGSRLPLAENIAQTADIAAMAHGAGVSCEGEIGFVGYDAGAQSLGTDPEEAAQFVRDTRVDAVAISVGNVHLQQDTQARIDRDRLSAIEALTDTPLVIHGGSGLAHPLRRSLAQDTRIAKFNIGTELRMGFGRALRAQLAGRPDAFDRIEILSGIEAPLTELARQVIRTLQ